MFDGGWDIGDLFGGGSDSASDFIDFGGGASDGGGFWDSAGNWIANNAGSLLRGVTALGGTLLGSSANSAAANRSADATLQAAAINAEAAREARAEMEAAKQRGIAAIRAGTQGYTDTVAPLLQARPINLPTYRGLTDAQRIGREDLLRRGQTTLATSGLRGAGRAGVASIMDADRRYLASAIDRNDADRLTEARRAQGAADNARSGLAQIRAQEGGSIANTEIGQGNRMADSIQNQGTYTASANNQAGQTQAGADLANAGLWTDALGTLGSVIAGSIKESNRDRYASTGSMI